MALFDPSKLNTRQVISKLGACDYKELEQILQYEVTSKNRRGVRDEIKDRLRQLPKPPEPEELAPEDVRFQRHKARGWHSVGAGRHDDLNFGSLKHAKTAWNKKFGK